MSSRRVVVVALIGVATYLMLEPESGAPPAQAAAPEPAPARHYRSAPGPTGGRIAPLEAAAAVPDAPPETERLLSQLIEQMHAMDARLDRMETRLGQLAAPAPPPPTATPAAVIAAVASPAPAPAPSPAAPEEPEPAAAREKPRAGDLDTVHMLRVLMRRMDRLEDRLDVPPDPLREGSGRR